MSITSAVRTASDDAWRRYVATLSPSDDTGASLLPEELPNEHSSLKEIIQALSLASQRAFSRGRSISIQDPRLGRIRGRMRMMVPQGREHVIEFDGELGYRAMVVVRDGEKRRSFVAYYRSRCMNPVRMLAYAGGTTDTSAVEFTPVSEKGAQRIRGSVELEAEFDRSLHDLAIEFRKHRNLFEEPI